MRHPLRIVLLSALLLARPADVPAQEKKHEKPLPVRIDEAIDSGVTWLKSAADSQGTWGKIDAAVNYEGERTSTDIPPARRPRRRSRC